MTEQQKRKSHAIIHSASAAAAGVGAGLAQIPGSDNAIIVPIQIAMTISLGAIFEVTIDNSTAKGYIASATASLTGKTISQFLVGWIPIVGNVINATTAGLITESIGWSVAHSFANNSNTEIRQIDF